MEVTSASVFLDSQDGAVKVRFEYISLYKPICNFSFIDPLKPFCYFLGIGIYAVVYIISSITQAFLLVFVTYDQ